ncbi:hypothetical protein D3C81_1762580 [compost metagenome]
MPYVFNPPAFSFASNTVTPYPNRASSRAADNPAGPPPITATFKPLSGPGANTRSPLFIAVSVAKRCSKPIVIGFEAALSTQAPSHSCSVGQTREQEAPTGLSSIITLAEPFKLPVAIFLINDGILMPVGHAFMQGAS